MNRRVGVVLLNKNNRVLIIFPYIKVLDKYHKLQWRLKAKWIKGKKEEYREGDIIYVLGNHGKKFLRRDE